MCKATWPEPLEANPRILETTASTPSHPQSCCQQFLWWFGEIQTGSAFFIDMKSFNPKKIMVKVIDLRQSRDLTWGWKFTYKSFKESAESPTGQSFHKLSTNSFFFFSNCLSNSLCNLEAYFIGSVCEEATRLFTGLRVGKSCWPGC